MSDGKLKFSLGWISAEEGSHRVTTAVLGVSIGEFAIWPVEGASEVSLEIQADDLLSHLVEFWKPLILRQTYPIGARPDRPSFLRAEAERRWSGQPSVVAEREGELVTAFEDAHDLSRCFAGQFGLPPLWLVREGEKMLVETRSALHLPAFSATRDALVQAGNEIAERLVSSGDERWADLVEAWRDRDDGDPAVLLAWSASLDRETARRLRADAILSAPKSVKEAADDNDELRVAARMASALPPEQIRQIIRLAKGLTKQPAPKLDAIGSRTFEYIDRHFADHRPYEQGEAAANFLREQLDLASVGAVDIFGLIEDFGAALLLERVEPSTLFALAVWGRHHGPAILLNEGSLRTRRTGLGQNPAARVTLAHELCHLLLDRGHALGAVEVLNSRMPLPVEQRAKAFAGEFLLPGRVAADSWLKAKSPRSMDGLGALLRNLARRYGVTRSVAAWKLEHGLQRHDVDLRIQLDAVSPNR